MSATKDDLKNFNRSLQSSYSLGRDKIVLLETILIFNRSYRRLDASPQTKILPTPLTLSLFVQRLQTILINVTICCVFILLWTFTIMVCGERKVKKTTRNGQQLRHSSRMHVAIIA